MQYILLIIGSVCISNSIGIDKASIFHFIISIFVLDMCDAWALAFSYITSWAVKIPKTAQIFYFITFSTMRLFYMEIQICVQLSLHNKIPHAGPSGVYILYYMIFKCNLYLYSSKIWFACWYIRAAVSTFCRVYQFGVTLHLTTVT